MRNRLTRVVIRIAVTAFLSYTNVPLFAHNVQTDEFRNQHLETDCFGNDYFGDDWYIGEKWANPNSTESMAVVQPEAVRQRNCLQKYPLVDLASTYAMLRTYTDSIVQQVRATRLPSRLAHLAGFQFARWNGSDANIQSLAVSIPEIGQPPSPFWRKQFEQKDTSRFLAVSIPAIGQPPSPEGVPNTENLQIASCPFWNFWRDQLTSQTSQRIASLKSTYGHLTQQLTRWFDRIANTQIARAGKNPQRHAILKQADHSKPR